MKFFEVALLNLFQTEVQRCSAECIRQKYIKKEEEEEERNFKPIGEMFEHIESLMLPGGGLDNLKSEQSARKSGQRVKSK